MYCVCPGWDPLVGIGPICHCRPYRPSKLVRPIGPKFQCKTNVTQLFVGVAVVSEADPGLAIEGSIGSNPRQTLQTSLEICHQGSHRRLTKHARQIIMHAIFSICAQPLRVIRDRERWGSSRITLRALAHNLAHNLKHVKIGRA